MTGAVCRRPLVRVALAVMLLYPAIGGAQAVQPGSWDVTTKVVDLAVPGMPGFIARMVRGKSKAEHKKLAAGQEVEALLAPDPKARCRIDDQHVAGGRYTQALSCPQKHGAPLTITRAGTYDATGFTGRATVTGTTPKGPLRITLEQHAARIGS